MCVALQGEISMKKINIIFLACLLIVSGCKRKKVSQERLCSRIELEQIVALIPKSSDQIYLLVEQTKQLMDEMFTQIDQIPLEKRTYLNTVLVYEQAYFQFYTNQQVLRTIAQLSQDSGMQTAANVALLDLAAYATEMLKRNVTLFQALDEYAKHGKDPYRYTKPVAFFLDTMLHKFALQGMRLPVAQRAEVDRLEQEINQIAGRFYSNASYDRRHIIVGQQDLPGVSEQFLATLSKDDAGNYILPADMQTFVNVMQNCQLQSTRHAYYLMFGQCGYPQNEDVLQQLVQKRHEMAQLLGFDNFASYQLDDLVIKTPKKADHFLWSMIKELQPYDDRDFAQLTRHLPSGVTLTSDKKLHPWDEDFVKSWYRKQHFKIDQNEIAQYFQLDHVVSVILQKFSQFFHVSYEPQEVDGLWTKDLTCYRIRSLKHQAVLGYLFFDLYQRETKQDTGLYQLTLIPSIRDDCSIPCVGACTVVGNFAHKSEEQPILLEFGQVVLLLHEMGHAMHTIFGATRFTQFSGNQVAHDFMQTPSQMLEYWFDEPEFLHDLGCHVKTGEPMSRSMIEQLIASEKFGRSSRMLKQLFLGLVSLHLFESVPADTHVMIEKIYKKVFRHIAYEPENYFEMSFAHFADQQHCAAYYAYPWSAVIAADFFAYVKLHGLFNHEIGSQYITEVLSPGGSRNPYEMIKRFLGRPFHRKSLLEQL